MLKSMKSGKSPGPDGNLPEFLLATWNITGADFFNSVFYFFTNLKLPKNVNATAITLVQKVPNLTKVSDFRPISCCNVAYKCISKMLADGLKGVIKDIISPVQNAIIANRSMG